MRSATRKKTGRDARYLEWIRSLPCVCCFVVLWSDILAGLQSWESLMDVFARQHRGTESAHIGERGLSQKCPDREAAPLCGWHHRTGPESHHRLGKKFWAKWGIDRDELIRKLNERFDNAE
jgi:hypothetical protein